jgi:protein-L-isoaspartate(D-aspartate) O-methyltransferase
VRSSDLAGIGMTSQRTRERLIQRLEDQGISNQAVLDVIRSTPRHLFVDEALSHRAYEDTALPIGFSQTLSQPYIVARMTEILLSQGPIQKVLEIGTGSGYQTTVLSQLVSQVVSVERIEVLLKQARERFRKLRLNNITANLSDGSFGFEQHAPYNGIISTAAPHKIPQQLLVQLAPNGLLVIPVGNGVAQELRVIKRIDNSDRFEEQVIEKVKFVPLLGGVSHAR